MVILKTKFFLYGRGWLQQMGGRVVMIWNCTLTFLIITTPFPIPSIIIQHSYISWTPHLDSSPVYCWRYVTSREMIIQCIFRNIYVFILLDSLHYVKSSFIWDFSRSFLVPCAPFLMRCGPSGTGQTGTTKHWKWCILHQKASTKKLK